MLHSLSKDTAFTGETAPRHIFLCSDSQCLPPGDPRTLCAKHGYLITGKSFIGCELPASNCAEITGSLHVKFCRATSARYNNGRPPACWIATCFRNGYKPWLSKHVQKKIYCEPFFKGNGLFSSYLLEMVCNYELHLTDCYRDPI